MSICIGVDTGGTFTDLVLVDKNIGSHIIHKLPTTPTDPALCILDGVGALLDKAETKPEAVTLFVHGTTLATNAILQHRCSKTGMLVTSGFADVLSIARQRRPGFYNLSTPKPLPPVARDCIFEIDGRTDEQGECIRPLDERGIVQACSRLKEKQVAAIAICFIHAYANPAQEERAKAILQEYWPDVHVCLSSEVLREFREFERFASTCVNASLLPILGHYLEDLSDRLRRVGLKTPPLVMQSNGGAVSLATVRARPINTFFSGPAGGVIATTQLGVRAERADMISFDMGGTSTDVCLIQDGKLASRSEHQMGGFPVRMPSLDIHTIGAGGGSIAWVDPGGLLKVGPESAGANPGPALYGRGGSEATVTDANILLGRLSGTALIGGAMAAYPEESEKALKALGQRLGMDPLQVAAGIISIVNANMMGAVRVVSIERGEDPRTCALVAFGGAGPLHAADVAKQIGINSIIVPPHPGIMSAIGLIDAGRRGDFSVTTLVPATPDNLNKLTVGFDILEKDGEVWKGSEGLNNDSLTTEWHLDLRYVGQAFQLTLSVAHQKLDKTSLQALVADFHLEHERLNGYAMPDHRLEIVTIRLSIIAKPTAQAETTLRPASAPASHAIASNRAVWFHDIGFVDTPVYDRAKLNAGHAFAGPAIIEQTDATTVVPPEVSVNVDNHGFLHLCVGT